jgi:hypothetical protein
MRSALALGLLISLCAARQRRLRCITPAYAEAEIEVGHYRGRSGQLVGLALAQSITRLSNSSDGRT